MIWYPEYVNFINEMRQTPFEWGTNDCGASWVGRVIEIVTGKNPFADLDLGNYSTAIGAVRAMRKLGYSNLREATEHVLGKPSQHPVTGAIGDIALIRDESPFGYAFGVVNGERIFFRTESGLGTADLLEAECIFKL